METTSAPPNKSHPRPTTNPHTDNMQTGIFLQQFTNSVNRALHKQTCTCNGRLYTADELLSKSNSALFAIPSQSKSNPHISKRRKFHLPPIDGLSLSHDSATPLKNQLDREIGIISRPKDTEPISKSVDGELRLPSIMDIRDTRGNNWKILQEPSGGRHRHNKRPPLEMIRQMLSKNSYHNPHVIQIPTDINNNTIEEEEDPDAAVIKSVLEANTPINSTCDPDEDDERRQEVELDTEFDVVPEFDKEIKQIEPSFMSDLAPVCTHAAQVRNFNSHCCDIDGVYHDDFERKILLRKYNSEVRSRKISYMIYLRKVSQMSLCPCLQLDLYQKPDDVVDELGVDLPSAKERAQTAASRLTLKSRSLPAPDFVSNIDTLSLYARGENDFEELEKLYSRNGYSMATLHFGDAHLPKNFIERERQELRLMYPMYDWRVQYNQHMLTSQTKLANVSAKLQEQSQRQRGSNKKVPHKDSSKSMHCIGLNHDKVEPQEIVTKKALSDTVPLQGTRKHSVSFSSSSFVNSNESITRSRVIPKQPPTTPVEKTITIASASAPELLTIAESEENGRNSQDFDVDINNNENGAGDEHGDANESEIQDDFREKLPNEDSLPNEDTSANIINEVRQPYERTYCISKLTTASVAGNIVVQQNWETNALSLGTKEIRPSVQLLQIDTDRASTTRGSHRSVFPVSDNTNNDERFQMASGKTVTNQPSIRAEGARVATQKVVFVSPATSQP